MTRRVSASEAGALAERGAAVLLDVRPPAAFARAHAPGALSVPFSARGLAGRVRVALTRDAAAVVIADDATADTAAAQLVAAGMPVAGTLDGGYAAWAAAGLRQDALREMAVEDLPSLPSAGAVVIDVREPLEWATGHVPGALLVPLGALREALPTLPRDRTLIAICEAGVRSCTAASIIAAAGFADVAHVPAGSSGYRRSGLPLAYPADSAAEDVPAR